MKKLLSILTLLVVAVTGAWANQTSLIDGITLPDVPAGTLDVSDNAVTKDANGWYVLMSPKTNLTSSFNWYKGIGTNGGNAEFTIPEGTVAPYPSGSQSINRYTLRNNGRSHAIRFTGVETASFLGNYSSDDRKTHVSLFSYDGVTQTLVGTKSVGSGIGELVFDGLSKSTNYIAYIYSNSGSNTDFYGFALKAPAAGPSIKTQPQSAEYSIGATATALTVVAENGEEPYTYQWYSCDDAEKNNSQPVGTNSASYVPSTTNAGTFYYYCEVTDANGSTESAVATIVVAAATAPTISVSGAPAEPVKVGTAVTLTAEMTGFPAPTIKWFSNTTASTSGGTVITGETGLTYSPSTATAGTYYYYAQAVNTEGDALSAVQTIVVKEQVSVPKVNGERYFLTNVNATINVVDGTTVKYKKNGGAEETYVAETVISSNEDMELQVWAEKDGSLPSDKVTVNFKKVTDTGVTAVGETTSWDWSKPTGTNVAFSPAPLEYLLSEETTLNYDKFEAPKTSVKYISPQRLDVEGDYVQAHGFVIKTSVSGILDFKVRGTNSNTRYVVVNGENAGTVNSSSSDKNINSIAIPVGTTVVYGLDVASQAANNIRYFNVTFTPAVNVTSAEWATTTTPAYAVDFDANANVYVVKSIGESITLTPITDAPANTPIIVNAPTGSYTMTPKAEATTDVTGNLLKSSDGSVVGTATGSPYVLGKNTSDVVGFGPLANGTTLEAGKAYILASEFAAAKDFYTFVIGDEESETTSIRSIENSESRIENYDYIYNLAGQKVSKDYKGIVVVNGKKVVRK